MPTLFCISNRAYAICMLYLKYIKNNLKLIGESYG